MFVLPDRDAIEAAARIVYAAMPPTPQYAWSELGADLGVEVWVKHENHTPLGAFKVRGGLVFMERLRREQPEARGVISATTGNHGQSISFAARRAGLRCVIYVPHGNSPEKNAAMRSLGAELIEHGDDFQAAREEAARVAVAEGLVMVPPFHPDLVRGVATYWAEFFRAVPDLEVVYCGIGQGSGITAASAARAIFSPRTRIIGVVSAGAPCYARSIEVGHAVDAPVTTRLAAGLACRVPDPDSLAVVRREVERIIEVTDAEVAEAMRRIFATTHNVAEGAGAAGFAAACRDRDAGLLSASRIGLVISGGNADSDQFARVLQGGDQ
jgi:threonine dehydratase